MERHSLGIQALALLVSLALAVFVYVCVPLVAFADSSGAKTNQAFTTSPSDSGESPSDEKADGENPSEPVLKPGWVQDEDGNWRYVKKDLSYATGWQKIGGNWYYLDPEQDGVMLTGWQKIKDDWHYFDPSSGCMLTGWQEIGKNWYYFKGGSNGRMKTGWLKIDDDWFYLKPGDSGRMLTGWQKIDGDWYYFKGGNNGRMKTGWLKVDDDWFYLDPESGKMQTGWQSLGGYWYYLTPGNSGKMYTGWLSWEGYWYCLSYDTGRMLTGWNEVDGDWYYLDPGGWMYYSTYIDNCYLGKNGAWTTDPMLSSANSLYSATNYVVVVDTYKNWVGVYKGSRWNRSAVRIMRCTSGAPATPTVKGEYSILDWQTSFGDGYSYVVWNATRFYGGYFFHSILYAPGSKSRVVDGRLGMNLSHGCVRLSYSDSSWIYNNLPSGTKVYVY